MKLDKKDAHSVEFSCQHAIQGVCVVGQSLEQRLEAKREPSYFLKH